MRELTVRIRFTLPSLGNVRTYQRLVNLEGVKKKRTVFLLPRNHEGKVILMQSWWASVMRNAADVLCRHQGVIKDVRFALEVDGTPRPFPEEWFQRFYDEDRFTPHEQFAAGDVIGVSCLVPATINDDDFWRLMSLGGEYYGMSPYRPGEFGFFKVEGIEKRGPQPDRKIEKPESHDIEEKTPQTSETIVTRQ